MPAVPRIAIIGGGFSGATTALHLLLQGRGLSFSLDIIEPRTVLGAGLAYSTQDPEHRINVAAARMTPLPEEPEHFDRWFRQSTDAAEDPAAIIPDGRAYPRRASFGHYVDRLVRDAAIAAPGIAFRHLQARAQRIEAQRIEAQRIEAQRIEAGRDNYRITLDDGTVTNADLLVLSPGHPPPGIPSPFADVASHARFIANPWQRDALAPIRPTDWVLILGTGLTMADTVASLRARGHVGEIAAVSRRGQLSQPRTSQTVQAFGDFERFPARTVSELLHRVRATARELQQAGRPWEDVVDAIRQQGAIIWRNLSLIERRRFLRHLRPYWDSHRYQVAPQLEQIIATERQRRLLHVLAAACRSVAADRDLFRVKLHLRGKPEGQLVERHFHAVINCTGPDHRTVVSGNPVLASLQAARLLTADPLGLGIHVDEESRVIGASGAGQETILVAGPLARGTFGELMGLPQVTLHAKAVADRVATWIHQHQRDDVPRRSLASA